MSEAWVKISEKIKVPTLSLIDLLQDFRNRSIQNQDYKKVWLLERKT